MKSIILDFVAHVTDRGGPHYVPMSERIAVFDDDGTLWCEHPLQVQCFFGQARLEEMAVDDPTLRERQPFKAYLERDMAKIHNLGRKGLFEVGAATRAGMTAEEFDAYARNWLATSKHPRFGRLFTELTYQPQIELVDLLGAHGFKIFIVSHGGIDLIRCFSEERYGIPRDQVVGPRIKTRSDRGEPVNLAEIDPFEDREVEPHNIGLHIGHRPIIAVGNSDGDLAMLRDTKTGPGARLALLVHHDDDEREAAYDREFRLSPLAEALDRAGEYGLTVVSMKDDWRTVFSTGS